MRDVVVWILGTVLAFALAATAFLLLANLLATPPERNLAPPAREDRSSSALDLELDSNQLGGLEAQASQKLDLAVRNEGDIKLSDIHLTLEVASENTALSETRYYRAGIKEMGPGAFRKAAFAIDLSPPKDPGRNFVPDELKSPQTIVEIQATTPSGVSAVRTVILPLQAGS